jgi:hypothetical protein
VAFINNYSTLSEERHKKISNILSNTEIWKHINLYRIRHMCVYDAHKCAQIVNITHRRFEQVLSKLGTRANVKNPQQHRD